MLVRFNVSSISLLVIWFTLISPFTCKQSTRSNEQSPGDERIPRVSSLVSGQTGYHTRVELASGLGYLLEIEETFNSDHSFGKIKLNDGGGHRQQSYWYYQDTKEYFFIDSDQLCNSSELNDKTKKSVIDSWLIYNRLADESTIFSDAKDLGPMSLFVHLSTKSDYVRYVGTAKIAGLETTQWFFFENEDELYFEAFFDARTTYPVRLVITYPVIEDNPATTTTINVITFEPITVHDDNLISYPYGYGCDRSISSSVPVPQFASSDAYNLYLEASLFFTQPDRSALTTARISRYQGIYSYDLKENEITKRIVHDPKLLIDYQVDPLTGTCVEGLASNGRGYGFTYLRWPYSEGENYNLLDESVFNLSSTGSINYMGQINSGIGVLDVFEKKRESFFTLDDGLSFPAVIIYFFPTSFGTKLSTRNPAPDKIIIKPIGELTKIASVVLVDRIEIRVIEYHEDEMDFENRFDISGCYDKPVDYTWFQIIFSGRQRDLLSWKDQDDDLKKAVRSDLSFIPLIRIPDIRVSLVENLLYISFKLLERPSYEYDFGKTPGFTISNPTQILLRDHVQDCGEMCAEDEHCTNFAYCNNLECRLFSSNSLYPSVDESVDCDGYIRNGYFVDPKNEVEANFLKSSKRLIHEIKDKLTRGELNLNDPVLSALDLFIVSDPNQRGDLDSLLNKADESASVGDHYKVLLSNRRLEGNALVGLDYSKCLIECDNDDECLTVSFCPSRNGECILSNSSKDVNQQSTVLSQGCNIFMRSYLSFYRKFPGFSLILESEQVLKNVDIEDCARACSSSASQPCESFDYCPQADLYEASTKAKACFLHKFHIAKDSIDSNVGKTWNLNETQCDHYAKILSKDYKQLVGYKFSDNMKGSMIIQTSHDLSMENCAGSCTNSGLCESFDYCESQSRTGMITTKCQLSSLKPDLKSTKSAESSSERCSIYVSKYVDPPQSTKSHVKSWLFILLSFVMFISAFIIGLLSGRHYFLRH